MTASASALEPAWRSVGVDVGGTTMRACIVDHEHGGGRVVTKATSKGPAALVASIAELVADVLDGASIESVESVGIGLPGAVDERQGTVRYAVNLGIGATPLPIAARLQARLGVPVHVENDVNAAAVGAHHALTRDGRPARDLAYVSVGTGIAAGWVLGGRLRRGAHGVAGDIGHLSIDPSGPPCLCGQRGCIEALASGGSVSRRWPTGDPSPMRSLMEAATIGDTLATDVWRDVTFGLASAVTLVALSIDPDAIVLGGGVAEVGDELLDAIRRRLIEMHQSAPFLRDLDVGSRLARVSAEWPLGAVGAVLAARPAGS